MARNRDSTTQRNKRYNQAMAQLVGVKKYNSPIKGSRTWMKENGGSTARVGGRRGVRARRREARIAQRNSQPSGGTITNS